MVVASNFKLSHLASDVFFPVINRTFSRGIAPGYISRVSVSCVLSRRGLALLKEVFERPFPGGAIFFSWLWGLFDVEKKHEMKSGVSCE